MGKILRFLRRYPWVVASIIVGAVGLILQSAVGGELARWMVSAFAGIVALQQGIHMVRSLARKQWGLDVLAVTAIVATLLVGEYWASLIIVLMLTGGEALEDAAAFRASRELTALLDRVPHTAHRLTSAGVLEDIPASSVAPGDRLVIRPSEVVPVDGELVTPSADIDESSLTGESLPVSRSAGETILSGSVNGPVALDMIATRKAEDSEYQRIVGLVQQAAASKAPLVRLADRYAIPFTALAYTIAAIAWAISGDPVRFAEVLVVATPCPLLIAAPVAFMGGMSRAASAGIVIKDAGTLERLSEVRTAAFDKTGTLTHGKPEVGDIVTLDPSLSAQRILQLVASAEQYSSHVLASAIVQEAHSRGLRLLEARHAQEVATDGVRADIEGHTVHVGKPAFIAAVDSDMSRYRVRPGETVVYVAIDEKYVGHILLRDVLRDEATATLHDLNRLGINRTVMLSGDQQDTAETIAHELGITEVHGECLPADKVAIVHQLTPRRVMMVGDGVNDAPVLAASDVGVALGARGSTAASESADVVILVDDLARVADAVEIGQSTIRIALQSIWLGIIISVGLMLIAAAGFLPAIVGALLQEVVDLVAILGALRALRPPRSREKRRPVDSKDVQRARV
jgi:heavy metal translocating P-type ATPase